MRKLVIATRNPNKSKELVDLLHGISFEIKTLADYPHIPDIEENGNTYKENAMKKAMVTANLTGEMALADDSGLEVVFLGGKPGIHSARYAPDDSSKIEKLLKAMNLVHMKDRHAQFICFVAIAEPHGQVWTISDSCKGVISNMPRGNHGFGFDPVFLFPELNKTFAELTPDLKAEYGHRGKAIRNARLILQKIQTVQRPAPPVKPEEHTHLKYASIDIGTNCLRMLVGERDKEHNLKTVMRYSEIVRLGQGMLENKLSPGAMNRVFKQMNIYMEALKKYQPIQEIYVGATSAVRDATNQADFTDEFYKRFKLQVKVLNGEEEAQLAFLGATYDINIDHLFMVDIGGGSTEFIQGKHKILQKAKSLNIGSVRFTEKYIFHDPVLPKEVDQINQVIEEELKKIDFGQMASDYRMIGTGGTMTTIAAMSQQLVDYDSSKIQGFVISIQDIELLTEELMKRTIEERKELPGLVPGRADVILAGVLLCKKIMQHFGFKDITVSERDLLDGLILSQLTLYR